MRIVTGCFAILLALPMVAQQKGAAKAVPAPSPLSLEELFRQLGTWPGPRPLITFDAITEGSDVSPEWDVVKATTGKTVEFEAVFDGIGDPAKTVAVFKDLTKIKLTLPKMELTFQVDAKLEGILTLSNTVGPLNKGHVAQYRHVPMLVAYSSPQAVQNWKMVMPGAAVNVKGKVRGASYLPSVNDIMIVHITLVDLEPLGLSGK